MTADHHRRAEDIFKSLLAADVNDPRLREVKLLSHCGNDSELLDEVRSLLRAHDRAAGPLDRPAMDIASWDNHATAATLPAGSHVGPYRIISPLGMGGMGVVYVAEQDRPRRTVALKVIRPGYAAPSTLRRFEYEAELLGRLQHPGIAQIIEAGAADTGSGLQPFFAMELVDGEPLTRYVSTHHLSTRARLELILKLCDAVEHAHQRGVIHRDLKPSNILVDRAGQPKILDFGVARATDVDHRVTILRTGERQLVGTLAYMSPEQVSGDPSQVDTRSDVYALGVILYELLAGRRPHAIDNLSLPEAVRVISDSDPKRLASVSTTLRGDLDTITAKALEREKQRRYQSASELAADLRRYLDHAPIAARPASAIYQLKKFARRNRAIVVGTSLAAAALIIATPVSIAAYLRAERARASEQGLREKAQASALLAQQSEHAAQLSKQDAQRSEQAAKKAAARSDQVAKLLKEMLDSIDPAIAKGRDVSVLREILARTEDRLASELAGQPDVEAEVRLVIASTYKSLDDLPKAVANQRLAVDRYKEAMGERSVEHIGSLTALARLLQDQSKLDEASQLYDQALTLTRDTLGPNDPATATLLYQLGNFKRIRGDLPGAEALLREYLELSRRLPGDQNAEIASGLNVLAITLKDQGKYAEAISLYREALAMQEKISGREDPFYASTLNNLASALYISGDFDAAEPAYREALDIRTRILSDDHSLTASSRASLAVLLAARGKLDEALPLFEKAVDVQRRRLGPDSIDLAKSLSNLAITLRDLRRFDEAQSTFDEVLRIQESKLTRQHTSVGDTLVNLAMLDVAREQWPLAEQHAREALAIQQAALAPDHPSLATAKVQLATILCKSIWSSQDGPIPTPAHIASAAEAERLMHEALPIRIARSPADSWQVPAVKGQLAEAILTSAALAIAADPTSLSNLDALRLAEPLCREAYDGVRARADTQPVRGRRGALRDTADRLARLYETWNLAEPNTGKDTQARQIRAALERELPPATATAGPS